MKSKKLLILIICVAVVAVIIVVLASVFSVRSADPVYHNFQGGEMDVITGAPSEDNILELTAGKSILFLSKEKVLAELNKNYPDWHAIGIVKNFPNILEVHFVKRVAVVKVNVSGEFYYLDSFGYVVAAPTGGSSPLDISSALMEPRTVKDGREGRRMEFEVAENNKRVEIVLESMMALWQCKCEIKDIPTILGKRDVFTFDSDNSLVITTRAGATITVISPQENLTDRLIDGFSVYCNDKYELKKYGKTITVMADGKIITPSGGALRP